MCSGGLECGVGLLGFSKGFGLGCTTCWDVARAARASQSLCGAQDLEFRVQGLGCLV